jgi:hypothetical protein
MPPAPPFPWRSKSIVSSIKTSNSIWVARRVIAPPQRCEQIDHNEREKEREKTIFIFLNIKLIQVFLIIVENAKRQETIKTYSSVGRGMSSTQSKEWMKSKYLFWAILSIQVVCTCILYGTKKKLDFSKISWSISGLLFNEE